MSEVNRSLPHNCEAIPRTRGFHSIRSENMKNIYSIHKWKYSYFSLACIDDIESIHECVNHTTKYVKPWIHGELRTFSQFGNLIDAEMGNDLFVIDKDYYHLSDLVREGDVFVVITNNEEKVHYCLL